MGSSAKKKEKKKDFRKAKLKVGKTKAKPDNYTDTSFKAKSIVLKKQSISVDAPTLSNQINHHTALLRSRADTQRRDSLAYFANLSADEIQDAATELLPKLSPLISDPSSGVRSQLLKLFKRLPVDLIVARPDQILAWTRASMTHLAADIRSFSLDMLEWMLQTCPEATVSCRGGWYSLLQTFTTVLGWVEETESKGWSSYQKAGSKPGNDDKVMAKQLNTLAVLLRAGLEFDRSTNAYQQQLYGLSTFPYVHLEQHAIPRRSNPYAALQLFGPPIDDENQLYEDRDDRQRCFLKHFQPNISRGIEHTKKEQGELGRASAAVQKVLDSLIDPGD